MTGPAWLPTAAGPVQPAGSVQPVGAAVRSVYLGPGRDRWTPSSHAEVVAAAADGLLDEGHHLELKREIPAGDRGNKELGRDLASCAVDGGLIVVGVVDEASAAGAVVDVDLPGLAERVDQVARSRITPPLSVICRPLPNPDDPGRGVLLIEIPSSPDAPHMADQRYWGRGDRTKHTLADAEVRQLLAARAWAQQDAAVRLDRFVTAAAELVGPNPNGTVCVLAWPQAPRADAVAGLLYGPEAAAALLRLTEEVGASVEQSVGPVVPSLHREHLTYHRHADSVELLSEWRRGGHRDWPALLKVQFGTDGTVGLVCGAGTYSADTRRGEVLVFAGVSYIAWVRSVLAVAAAVADHAGYNGGWNLGFSAGRLEGALDDSRLRDFGAGYGPAYPDANYTRTTTASTAELLDTPAAVTGRLLLPLLRVLGTDTVHQKHLTEPLTPVPTP